MGYCADGYGKAPLKEGIDKWELSKRLDEKVEQAFGLEYEFDKNGDIKIYDNENYHEEDIRDFLNTLSLYIVDGEIEYSGDDDCHWKFVFNKETGGWDEIEGEVYYSLSDFTDEVLVEELKRRGYKVIK